MARWEPNSRERLQGAALDLFNEQGFEGTTVAQISARVGVTQRTFFRHFIDKRDVLFAGSADLRQSLYELVIAAPLGAGALDAIIDALSKLETELTTPRHFLRQRLTVIAANPELSERELMKFEALAGSLADALRARGVPEITAALAGSAGITIFRTSYERWVSTDEADMAQVVAQTVRDFRAAVGTGGN